MFATIDAEASGQCPPRRRRVSRVCATGIPRRSYCFAHVVCISECILKEKKKKIADVLVYTNTHFSDTLRIVACQIVFFATVACAVNISKEVRVLQNQDI